MKERIGKPVDRIEGRLKVTGQARYAADFAVANPLYAHLVTSTIGVGRITQGTLKPMMDVLVCEGTPEEGGKSFKGRVNQVLTFEGLERRQTDMAGPGDIVLVNGIEDIGIGVTLTDPLNPKPLPMLHVDEPTLTMNFCVNNSPLAGREGKYVTGRQLWDRLQKELQSNVALKVKE